MKCGLKNTVAYYRVLMSCRGSPRSQLFGHHAGNMFLFQHNGAWCYKLKRHWFYLLWIFLARSWTTNPKQIDRNRTTGVWAWGDGRAGALQGMRKFVFSGVVRQYSRLQSWMLLTVASATETECRSACTARMQFATVMTW